MVMRARDWSNASISVRSSSCSDAGCQFVLDSRSKALASERMRSLTPSTSDLCVVRVQRALADDTAHETENVAHPVIEFGDQQFIPPRRARSLRLGRVGDAQNQFDQGDPQRFRRAKVPRAPALRLISHGFLPCFEAFARREPDAIRAGRRDLGRDRPPRSRCARPRGGRKPDNHAECAKSAPTTGPPRAWRNRRPAETRLSGNAWHKRVPPRSCSGTARSAGIPPWSGSRPSA